MTILNPLIVLFLSTLLFIHRLTWSYNFKVVQASATHDKKTILRGYASLFDFTIYPMRYKFILAGSE
jgi:hypothetical protein